MLSAFLGLNATNPPNGWLKCLINCLRNAGNDSPGRRPYLVLDDFGRTRGKMRNSSWRSGRNQNTNAVIIVLTRAKEDENFLLSQSDFGVQNSLVEYLSTQTIEICFRTVNGLACAWDIPRYKMSARHQPRFVKEFTRDRIKNAIDQYVRSPQ